MRMQLQDMTVRTDNATVKMWSESGPEWGGKQCAVHQFGPGVDAAPAFAALPGGLCPAPHWGYLLKGELTVRFKDGTEEVMRAGDAFYWPAGHTFFTAKDAKQDCMLIEFSERADIEAMKAGFGDAKT